MGNVNHIGWGSKILTSPLTIPIALKATRIGQGENSTKWNGCIFLQDTCFNCLMEEYLGFLVYKYVKLQIWRKSKI